MKTHTSQETPVKWPFPPRGMRGKSPRLTPRAMFTDICLVAVWGAMIPGLMWFGAAAGF